MKRYLVSLSLVLFVLMFSCAPMPVVVEEPKNQRTFAFPIIGDINFTILSPRVFVTQKAIDADRIETISKYNKFIPVVRIVTNKRFSLKTMSVQYIKEGKFYAYKYSGRLCRNCGKTDHGDFLFITDTTLSKKEIKAIVRRLKFPKGTDV